jgi:hypothetical protein
MRYTVPKTPRVVTLMHGAVARETFPCDPGCMAYACQDLEQEVVERVLQDRFDDPWPPESWQHWSPLDGGKGIVITRVHHGQ